VIWMSRGWALLSGPRIDLSINEQDRIFHQIVKFSNELSRAQITLYSVDPLGATDAGRLYYYQSFLNGVKFPKDAQLGNLALQVLSEQSGGRMCQIGHDLAAEIQHCIDDAHAYYLLSFHATRNDGKSPYHALTLQIDKPGLTTYTRHGYYVGP
jgi:VWFA-related protein